MRESADLNAPRALSTAPPAMATRSRALLAPIRSICCSRAGTAVSANFPGGGSEPELPYRLSGSTTCAMPAILAAGSYIQSPMQDPSPIADRASESCPDTLISDIPTGIAPATSVPYLPHSAIPSAVRMAVSAFSSIR